MPCKNRLALVGEADAVESTLIENVTVETVDVANFADVDDSADADDGADTEFAAGEWAGSVLPDADGNGPESHLIKGNADSMLFHMPDTRYYAVTKAEVWFDTEENAEAAGFSKPGSQADDAETENN